MSYLLKDPAAVLDYEVDWGAHYLNDEEVVESHWRICPQEEGGARVESEGFTAQRSSVSVSGGEPGNVYQLSNEVLTSLGRRDVRSIALRVETR